MVPIIEIHEMHNVDQIKDPKQRLRISMLHEASKEMKNTLSSYIAFCEKHDLNAGIFTLNLLTGLFAEIITIYPQSAEPEIMKTLIKAVEEMRKLRNAESE